MQLSTLRNSLLYGSIKIILVRKSAKQKFSLMAENELNFEIYTMNENH